MAIATINPANGDTLRAFDALTDEGLESMLSIAARAFSRHRRMPLDARAERMNRAAELLETRKRRYAELITIEMGKPIAASEGEVAKCAVACRYYADTAAEHLADEYVDTGAAASWIRYQPIGPVLAVMPWNFPFWQVFRFAAPALMAGNVGLLKHSSNVPQCALAIEEVFRDAGFEEGVFQTLLIESSRVEKVLRDPRVAAATLTGSEPAGRSVARIAGDEIKKTVLELGGSDPFIVMPSADLDAAVKTAVRARVVNSGQSCIAAKRFIVHQSIASEFERRFVGAMETLKVGDPMDPATEVGPLATPQILEELGEQVERSIAAGAKLLTGGRRQGERGNFYLPTVLANVPDGSPAADEELFGPVAALFRVGSVEEAIERANRTPFGLGAAVFTNDRAEREAFIEGIEAGQVFFNTMVASDPRIPFGGVKRSGYGRELGSFGIREFVNIKTIWIAE